nr:hypothetical protein [uncultured Allomuricauda sp.]
MEHYCLHIGKAITGSGLFLDLIGVLILIRIDIILRKIGVLKNRIVSDDSNTSNTSNQSAADFSGDQPIDVSEQFFLEQVNTPERNLKRSKWGFGLIIFGFIVQIISLFIDKCIYL